MAIVFDGIANILYSSNDTHHAISFSLLLILPQLRPVEPITVMALNTQPNTTLLQTLFISLAQSFHHYLGVRPGFDVQWLLAQGIVMAYGKGYVCTYRQEIRRALSSGTALSTHGRNHRLLNIMALLYVRIGNRYFGSMCDPLSYDGNGFNPTNMIEYFCCGTPFMPSTSHPPTGTRIGDLRYFLFVIQRAFHTFGYHILTRFWKPPFLESGIEIS